MRIECRQQITICGDESYESTPDNFWKLKGIEEDLNRRIRENNERFTVEDVYRHLGIEIPKLPLGADQEFFKTYGWDRKGFRQLYTKIVTYMPID